MVRPLPSVPRLMAALWLASVCLGPGDALSLSDLALHRIASASSVMSRGLSPNVSELVTDSTPF